MTVASLLQSLRDAHRPRAISGLFAGDPARFDGFSRRFDDLILDFSRTALTQADMGSLLQVAEVADVAGQRARMFAGEAINATEGRAVLHVALRARLEDGFAVAGRSVGAEIAGVLARLSAFSDGVRAGRIAAADGKPFTDVVNIGIGGSDLGPAMVTQALAPFHDGPRAHFVSNVDGAHLADTLKGLDPARTLFIVASKTFTTVETLMNAASARRWLVDALGEGAIGVHFAAVSSAVDKAAAFGIPADRVFGFWDWVGGRYSVWSAVGLPVMLAIGPARFGEFLAGARSMDRHFLEAPAADNLPLLMGLIGVWHRNVCGYPARAVLPYEQRLARLPAYLQQLDMESNGKRVRADGVGVEVGTGPIIFGEPGTNGQHAFYQLLHQGTEVIPAEFIVSAEGIDAGDEAHHAALFANCLAQAEALMKGRTLDEARAQLSARGLSVAEVERLAPHRVFPGNRPSITLLHRALTPFALGRLIALYEHRVFVEAAIWGINAFDQWGVELGKELATGLTNLVSGKGDLSERDSATAGLIRARLALKG